MPREGYNHPPFPEEETGLKRGSSDLPRAAKQKLGAYIELDQIPSDKLDPEQALLAKEKSRTKVREAAQGSGLPVDTDPKRFWKENKLHTEDESLGNSYEPESDSDYDRKEEGERIEGVFSQLAKKHTDSIFKDLTEREKRGYAHKPSWDKQGQQYPPRKVRDARVNKDALEQ